MNEAHREAAFAAALTGGRLLLRFFRKLDASKITEKAKHDLVSEADNASEQAIREVLAARFPSYSFLGEESGTSGENSNCWIVDPLDGTLNFVHGFPHWSVSVALWDTQGPVVGCILDPLRGDLFLAEHGFGSYWFQNMDMRKNYSGLGELESVSVPQRLKIAGQGGQCGLEGAFLATGFAFQLGDRFPRYLKVMESVFYKAEAIRRAGSAALDLAHTAAGIYGAFFEMGLHKWDMGAGVLLVQEAGGLVTDWDGTDQWWENGNVVAGNPGVHQELIELTRQQ